MLSSRASMLGKSYSSKFWGLKNGLLQYFGGKNSLFKTIKRVLKNEEIKNLFGLSSCSNFMDT